MRETCGDLEVILVEFNGDDDHVSPADRVFPTVLGAWLVNSLKCMSSWMLIISADY